MTRALLLPGQLELNDRPPSVERWYYYALTAVDEAGNESPRSPLRSIEFVDLQPPAAPKLSVVLEQGVALLRWTAPEPDIAHFLIYRTVGAAPEVTYAQVEGQREYRDHALEAGLVHAYQVVAVDQAGNTSDPSQTHQVTPQAK